MSTHTLPALLALKDKPEGLNVIACELRGWTDIREQDYCESHVNPYDGPVLQFWQGVSPEGEKEPLPPYATSLDAVAELEAGLTDEERRVYWKRLERLCIGDNNRSDSLYFVAAETVCASATQRLIALILVMQGRAG